MENKKLAGGIQPEENKTQYLVTDKHVLEAIMQEHYTHIGSKTTICLLMLNDGTEIIGYYSPVDPAAFEIIRGKEKARSVAIESVRAHLKSVVTFQRAVHIQAQMQAKQQEELLKQQNAPKQAPAPKQDPVLTPTKRSIKKVVKKRSS